MPRKVTTTSLPITITSALTEILHLEANSMLDDIGIEITNLGTVALSDVQILIRFVTGGVYHAVIAVADWTAILAGTQSLSNFLTAVGTVNPGTLAGSNATAWFIINPKGIESVSIQAKTASGTTTVTVSSAGRTPR